MSNVIGAILDHKMATLRDLQTYYSYEDAMDMMEVIIVRNYNDWAGMEEAKRKSGRR